MPSKEDVTDVGPGETIGDIDWPNPNHASLVCKYAIEVAKQSQIPDPEDIGQDSVFTLFVITQTADDTSFLERPWKGFLRNVVRFTWLNAARKTDRRNKMERRYFEEQQRKQRVPLDGYLDEVIESLPEEQQKVIQATCAGHSIRTGAKSCGISTSRFRRLLAAAKKTIERLAAAF